MCCRVVYAACRLRCVVCDLSFYIRCGLFVARDLRWIVYGLVCVAVGGLLHVVCCLLCVG